MELVSFREEMLLVNSWLILVDLKMGWIKWNLPKVNMSTLVVLIVNFVTKSAQLAMRFWCTQLVNINLPSVGRDQRGLFNVCCDSLDGDLETKQKILSKMIQVGPSQFSCSDCGFSTSYKNSVMNHIEAKHVGNFYFCHQCEKEFSSRVALNMHNSRHHRF